jgi:hypothetical protein
MKIHSNEKTILKICSNEKTTFYKICSNEKGTIKKNLFKGKSNN